MVEVLLNSMKNMLGAQATHTREFKEEAVRSNKNISSVLKDLYSSFSSSRESSNRQAGSLRNLENSINNSSSKIDVTNSLLRQSISIQENMALELKKLSNLFASMVNQDSVSPSNQRDFGIGSIIPAGAAAVGGAAIGAAVILGESSNLLGGGKDTGGNGNLRGGGKDTGGNGNLSVNEMSKIAKEAGFSDEQARIMGAIAAAESSGNPIAHNDKGRDNSYGLWQINMLGEMGQERRQKNNLNSNEELFDPKVNAAAAKKVFDEQGFDAWSVYKNGMYQQFLPESDQPFSEQKNNIGQMASLTPPYEIQPQNDVMGNRGGKVIEKQNELAGIRKMPLSQNLVKVLEQAASAAGADAVVYSGGQPSLESGSGSRTGSTRHDDGNAADLYLTKGGRILSDTNEEDKKIMAKFVSAAVSAGATGVGAGHSYMGPSNIHVGFGSSASWGGADWLSGASSGVYSNKDMSSDKGSSAFLKMPAGMPAGMGGDMSPNLDKLYSLLGMSGANLSDSISSYFGLSPGSLGTGETPIQEGLINYEQSEQEPSAPSVGQKPINSSINPNLNIENDSLENRANAISSTAVSRENDQINKSYVSAPAAPVIVNNQNMQGQQMSSDVNQSFDTSTRASWAPRIAVLRPDDNATKNLTWASRNLNVA